jgi:hypothetical protein
MNIAWQSFVAALLLIPGFLAVVGFYGASRAARDATPKSRLGEAAIVVFASFFIHGLMVTINESLLGWTIPAYIFRSIREALSQSTFPTVFWPIYIYILFSGFVGVSLGAGSIWLIERQKFKTPFFQFRWFHGWSFDYIVGTPRPNVLAHVLTNLGDDGYRIVYSGICYEMTLDKDRNVMLIVLSNVKRIKLEIDSPSDIKDEFLRSHVNSKSLNVDRLVIPTQSIVNIAFEPYVPEIVSTPEDDALLEDG